MNERYKMKSTFRLRLKIQVHWKIDLALNDFNSEGKAVKWEKDEGKIV